MGALPAVAPLDPSTTPYADGGCAGQGAATPCAAPPPSFTHFDFHIHCGSVAGVVLDTRAVDLVLGASEEGESDYSAFAISARKQLLDSINFNLTAVAHAAGTGSASVKSA